MTVTVEKQVYVHLCKNREGFFYISQDVTCEEGTVHLVGGDDVSRGRVLYCYNGTWYSVCAADDWDMTGEEARMFCAAAGHDSPSYGDTLHMSLLYVTALYFPMYAASALVYYGRGTGPILPLTIHCGSEQNTLSDCSTKELDVGQCTHVAGVNCTGLLSQLSQRVLKSCVNLLQLPVLLKT